MRIDLHSHILPTMDDGSRSIEESIAILDKMAADGTEVLVSTSHYYFFEESPEDFVKRRQRHYEELLPYLKPHHPKILLGAEVLYSPALIDRDLIDLLKIQGTDYILLEMPYADLTDKILGGVSEICDLPDVNVVVAHPERYLNYTSAERLEILMTRLNVLGQMNCSSLVFGNKRTALKLIKKGYIHVLGTDYHRLDRKHALLSEAEPILAKKISPHMFGQFMHNALHIIENKDMDEIV